MLSFLEAFDKVDKLNESKKFNHAELAVSKDSIFKFFSSPHDLNSALRSKLIWSNLKTDGLQHDPFCDKLKAEREPHQDWGFISLTKEPQKVALELHRPFGIEFDRNQLIAFLEEKNYPYNDNYNQFRQLTSSQAKTQLRLNCVGKRKDGTYFFALQGDWEPRDIDKATYDKLLDWLKHNAGNQLVHFDFTKVPADEICVKASSSARAYLHKVGDYIDWNNSTVTLIGSGTSISGNTYNILSNSCFMLHEEDGIGFRVIVREYVELWATCLNRQVGLNSQSGYTKHNYNNTIPPLVTLDRDTYTTLDNCLNEYEFRIYIPEDTIFKFKREWIKSIRLPNIYPIAISNRGNRFVRLEDIFDKFTKENIVSSNKMIDICDNEFLVNHETETPNIVDLYTLLNQQLHLKSSFYTYEDDSEKTKIPKHAAYKHINYEPSEKERGIAGRDRMRYLIDKSVLSKVFGLRVGTKEDANNDDYRVIKLVKGNNPSLIYKDLDLGNGPQPARLEVRGIILAQDEEGEWYINAIKKGGWNELPGGSFETLPSSETGLYQIAADKFKKETGLNISANDLTMLNQLTYMHEATNKYIQGLTKDTNLLYQITIDWTFIAILDIPIDPTKKFNSKEPSQWHLWKYMLQDQNFMSRYAKLVPIIREFIG